MTVPEGESPDPVIVEPAEDQTVAVVPTEDDDSDDQADDGLDP